MSVADLFNIPENESDFQIFSFHNQDMHRQIVNALAAQKNITLPLYPIDPIPFGDLAGWAIIHQALHNDLTGALGIVGNDFSSIDPQNKSELAAWIFLHAEEHVQAANQLGLS